MSGFEQAASDQAAAQAPKTGFAQPEEQATQTSDSQPQVTQLTDGGIVVNGTVYKAEAAVKKIEHADNHIQTLERENAEKDQTNLDLLSRIEALEKGRTQTDALDQLVASQAAQPVQEPAPLQEISTEDIVQAAVDTMKQEQIAQQQERNLNACIARAQEAFGDSFGTKIDAAGAAYSMELDAVMTMARNQPEVFTKLFIPESVADGKPDVTRSTSMGNEGQGVMNINPTPKKFTAMSSKQRHAEIQRRMAALNQGN